MGDSNLSLCQICKEPVWNFICPDCIAEGIKDFLPSSFTGRFIAFHKDFLSPFNNSDLKSGKCLECKDISEFTICPYCYTHEVYGWLGKMNKPLAERFINIFSFGFDANTAREFLSTGEPVTGDYPHEEIGICDECGEYTEELVFLDGEWICRNCGIHDE